MTMAKKTYTRININNVEAMYPRLDKPYKFSKAQNKTVPCDAFDSGAAYETSFNMTKEQAADLYKNMVTAWNKGRESNWPEKMDMPFTKLDDGRFQGKAKIKSAYGQSIVRPPTHYDAKGVKLDDGFKLTSGSIVNINAELYYYNGTDNYGISLRLRAVQVVSLAEMPEANPFGEVDGYSVKDEDDNPFGESEDAPVAEVEDVPAPKTRRSKKKAPAKKDDANELDDILNQFADDDKVDD